MGGFEVNRPQVLKAVEEANKAMAAAQQALAGARSAASGLSGCFPLVGKAIEEALMRSMHQVMDAHEDTVCRINDTHENTVHAMNLYGDADGDALRKLNQPLRETAG